VEIDIVIVAHQSARHIERAIDSLPTIANVVVIDNASTDASGLLAKRAGATVVANDVNAGFAAAANQGARLGKAAAILFLNPDAAIAPPEVAALARAFDRDPRIAIVSPRVQDADGFEQRVLWPFPSSARAWVEAFGLHRLRVRPLRSGFVTGTCFMVRRVAFEQFGGFDARYWLYGEETDLCRRAIDNGWRIELDAEAIATHAGAASRYTAPDLVDEHFARGTERYIADREGVRGLVSYRTANVVGAAIRALAPGSANRRASARRRLGRYLHALVKHPTVVSLGSPATAGKHAIVVCSLERWDDVWRRNQFMVRELLAADPQLRVLFVEPPFDWLHELRRHRAARRGRTRAVVPDGRLIAFQPVKVAPRVLGPIADYALRREVVMAVARLGMRSPMLWINDPSYAGLLATGWPSVYDITDDLRRMRAPARIRRRISRADDHLLRGAGAVVVCSRELERTRRPRRPDLRVIPNAVDRDHFLTPRSRPADLPAAPVAVYVGTLHDERLDVLLIAQVARGAPHLHLALVGPDALNDAERKALDALPNITLMGPRPYDLVPAYLQHADVVIVPHVVTPFTESLDPIKAYECLVVGRPTVATPVAGFRELAGALEVVEPECFATAVQEALVNPRKPVSHDVPSWFDRACAFRAALDDARATSR
jgi:GT2 family glycosyltransferase/glycosyltransferase involved in cell wall biosynthesis